MQSDKRVIALGFFDGGPPRPGRARGCPLS